MSEAADLEAYFDPPVWPAELGALHGIIGLGRRAQTDGVCLWLSLRANRMGGAACPLLPIELTLEGHTVYAWVEERVFPECLEPGFPFPGSQRSPRSYSAPRARGPWRRGSTGARSTNYLRPRLKHSERQRRSPKPFLSLSLSY